MTNESTSGHFQDVRFSNVFTVADLDWGATVPPPPPPPPLAAEAQQFRGGRAWFLRRAPGLRKYKVARATPKKADERGGGGGGGV